MLMPSVSCHICCNSIGDVFVHFRAAARRRIENVFEARKTFAIGITGFGQ